MGTKVQNKGVGVGMVFYLSCSLFSPSPDTVASSQSLSSSEAQPHPWCFNLCLLSVTSSGEVQLEVFLKQTDYFEANIFFLKFASSMMLSNISAFASLKEFKLTSFEPLLKEKKISSKLGVAFQGVLREQAWLPAVLCMNSGSGEISSNCSICTFYARLGFELHFFFFFRQTRALYASSSLFCAPLWRTFYAEKRWSGLWICSDVSSGGSVQGRNTHVPWNGRTSKPSASTRLLFAFSTHEQKETVTMDCSHLCVLSVAANSPRRGQAAVEMEAF